MVLLPKLTYTQYNPYQNCGCHFLEVGRAKMDKLVLKFLWKFRDP
jgi:hypothetical protein